MTGRGHTPALAAYVLHRYDWSESSLIVDLFTRELGRVAVAAKGAKRPTSQLRAVLLPFQRLHVAPRPRARRRGAEVHNLRGAEWAGGAPMAGGEALFSGFYLNELLMKLLARDDPHPALLDAYAATLAAARRRRRGRGAARVRAAPAARDRPAARPGAHHGHAGADARAGGLCIAAGSRRRRRRR